MAAIAFWPTHDARNASERRRASERFGRFAEACVSLLLMLKGYRILARRFKTRCGEVDLIALRGRELAFVEVKARRTAVEADEALEWWQADRIAAAASAFVARRARYRNHDITVDAVLVSLDRWPRHIPRAMQ